jgi:SAM-dependent methyltransferase
MGADEQWKSSGFWDGFGLATCPSFDGRTVLEIGCGHGNRCFEMAAHGATRVVGLDPYDASIAIARKALAASTDPWRDRVTFVEGTIETLPPERFDVIVSEATLEHVLNVSELLAEVHNRLRPGGRFYLGFGPLYHSPFGDHGWLRAVLPGRGFFPWPWGHLLFKGYAFKKLSQRYGKTLTNTRDWPFLTLNQHTLAEYQKMFGSSGLRVEYMRRNYVKSLKARLITAIGRLPVASRYLAMNMFVIFKLPS